MKHHIKNYNPKDRFSGLTAKYAKYRPGYPQEIADVLKERYCLASGAVFADIGSGTGIFSRLLLDNNYAVLGVEPNLEMRRFAEGELSNFAHYKSIGGSAEKTELADNSVDAIASAQSFHWFDHKAALPEFYRILKKDGIIILVWNERKENNDQFHADYEQALQKYCPEYKHVNHKKFSLTRIEPLFTGKKIEYHHFENSQVFGLEELIGRLESSSYCPKSGDSNHEPLLQTVKAMFEKFQNAGRITIEYDCVMYCIS